MKIIRKHVVPDSGQGIPGHRCAVHRFQLVYVEEDAFTVEEIHIRIAISREL